MPERIESQLLLEIKDFARTDNRFEIVGIFNPGAARVGERIALLVRVAQGITEKKEHHVASPRSTRGGYQIDYCRIADDDDGDKRKPKVADGLRRLSFISHLELVWLSPDGLEVEEVVHLNELTGQMPYEEFGLEDARITKIGDEYFITYVSVSSNLGVATSLMSTKDFKSFERRGVIFPRENKDVVLLPEKVNGLYHALHRPVGRIMLAPLAILAASSPDLTHWGNHSLVLQGTSSSSWYPTRIGAGTPPIKTERGWLSIIHGVRARDKNDVVGIYTAGAMLTSLDKPEQLIAVSQEPFLVPEEDYELSGYVDGVVFPTGLVRDIENPQKLLVYYGCADNSVAVTAFDEHEILASLQAI